MAFRTLLYYTVDAPVGPGKANQAEDVMLIQYIFGVIWPNMQSMVFPQMPNKPVSPYQIVIKPNKLVYLTTLKVDGRADDNLFGHILAYQKKGFPSHGLESLSQGGSDGVIDPITGPRTSASFSQHLMGALNNHLNAKLADKYNNLPWDLSVPPALREALRRNYK